MLDFLRFSSGIHGIGSFPLFFPWPFPVIQRDEQYPNPKDSESYIFPAFHLQSKGALNVENDAVRFGIYSDRFHPYLQAQSYNGGTKPRVD